MRRRYTKDLSDVDIAITGVPFDQAVTNRPGARFGPRAIREASTLQTFDPPYGWDFDPMQELNIVDYSSSSKQILKHFYKLHSLYSFRFRKCL